ncbi:DUF3006 domain-containing protein [Halococcoides cellulosivorans]|uniref:DUF3006 domain-containing protein n=1 Tax=Halococcoides cellulosivorans TaxID=1679096 RepID=A0A2R4X3W8_9EURY|nr:DUF3006 domain-containing protein [Halococcoides cellulosivorans]AWB28495.1 DUF3006 domain-containing protein [Halococcoides cellulosivorans]
MLDDGSYTAVVDRFEGDQAVLLIEDDGETIDERVLDGERLPEAGRHADAVLKVTFVDGDVKEINYEADETEARSERAQSRFDRLSRRPPDDDG